MTLWNLTTSTLHKEPPLIRGTSTAHKGLSLISGGGPPFIKNLLSGQCKISSNPCISSGKDDEVQCSIPYGRWRWFLFEFLPRVNAN